MMRARWRFVRFALVGFVGAVLQLLVILLLTKHFGKFSAVATPVAVEIAILHNFIWHECFTWSGRCPKGLRQLVLRLGRFHVGNGLISLGGNTIFMYWLVERLQAPVVPTAIGGIALFSF